MSVIATLSTVCGAVHAFEGALDGQGWCGFDWLRPGGVFVVSQADLRQEVRVAASFRWAGDGVVPRAEGKTGEHVILGLVQGVSPASTEALCPASGRVEPMLNSSRHGMRQGLHRQGVGVLLAPVGLVIEVWNGDGTARTWSAEHRGCALSVPAGTIAPPCVPVLAHVVGDDDFITARPPTFAIEQGRTYWLELRFRQETAGGAGSVAAQLRADRVDGPLLQAARMDVELPPWAPMEPLEVVVGRTGAEYPEHRYPSAKIDFSLKRPGTRQETR